MKHTKATTRIDLACRGYRLGLIKASKISGTTAQLQFYDDYHGSYEWAAVNGHTYYTIYTDKLGNLVSFDTCEIPKKYDFIAWSFA